MNFKVGDRVVVYDRARRIGEVVGVNPDFEINIRITDRLGEDILYGIHPKQLRRLKKKERRRMWINPAVFDGFAESFGVSHRHLMSGSDPGGWLEFIEVRK